MIFSELYSAYYNAVAAILSRIKEGEHSEKELQRLVAEHAFGESVLSILPALKSGKWQLVRPDMTTPLAHAPTMPLTDLQKRWLKAISLDPRVRLFDVSFPELRDVEPLFTPEDYRVYDKYGDGDPYEDETYIRHFKTVLEAIRQGTQIKFEMVNRRGNSMFARCRPIRLEYSEKDDKFRVITAGWRSVSTVNLARLVSCVPYTGEKALMGEAPKTTYGTVSVRVVDERNAMERFMLHFAHFEKQAEKTGKRQYQVKIRYDVEDEQEMVIRILSFGPLVEVTEPPAFRELLVEKLKSQKNCGLK